MLAMASEVSGFGARATHHAREQSDEKEWETLRLFPSPPTADHPAFRVRPLGPNTAHKPRPMNVLDIATFDADELAGMAIMINEERTMNSQTSSVSIQAMRQQAVPHNYSKPAPSARYRPDSWSIHYDYTDQAPYTARGDDGITAPTGLSNISEGNASYELAEFLRTTAPKPPHRKPSKIDLPGRAAIASQHASHLMKLVHKSSIASSGRKKLGSLLQRKASSTTVEVQEMLPSKSVKQEVSRAGKKYLALQVPEIKEDSQKSQAVSSSNTGEALPDFVFRPKETDSHRRRNKSNNQDGSVGSSSVSGHAVTNPNEILNLLSSDVYQQNSIKTSKPMAAPIAHIISTALPARSRFNDASGPSKNSENQSKRSDTQTSTPRPRRPPREFASLSSMVHTQEPAQVVKSTEKQPNMLDQDSSPRRREDMKLDAHAVEEQASVQAAEANVVLPSATSEVPVESAVTPQSSHRGRRRKNDGSLKPAYTQPEIGSLKRNRKRATRERSVREGETNDDAHPATPRSAKDRSRADQELIRAHPNPVAVVRISSTHTTRLGVPKSPVDRSVRTASMLLPEVYDASAVQLRQNQRSMTVYELPGQHVPLRLSSTAATKEHASRSKKKHATHAPNKVAVNDGKAYAPRPRSAHNAKSAARRRSRASIVLPSSHTVRQDSTEIETPILPPSRTLPEAPTSNGPVAEASSQRREGHKTSNSGSSSSSYETVHSHEPPAYEIRGLPHIVSQAQRLPVRSKTSASRIDARLEALEKQNALLSAALMAVLKTNGALNSAPLPAELFGDYSHPDPAADNSLQQVGRSASRHGFGGSADSAHALDMYMYTRTQ